MTAPRRLGRPRSADIGVGEGSSPVAVGRLRVESVLEEWLVEDRWWTDRPVRRRYFEVVLESGRCVMVFRDLVGGRWYTQRG